MLDMPADWQCLALREVPLEVRLGVYAEERTGPQRVSIDVELWRRAGRFAGTGIADCLDYARVHDWLVETLPRRPHVELLEQLAEDIIGKCLEDGRVEACRVKIRKLDAYGGKGWPEIDVWRRSPTTGGATASS
jgi:dihydroneopterin aldolase